MVAVVAMVTASGVEEDDVALIPGGGRLAIGGACDARGGATDDDEALDPSLVFGLLVSTAVVNCALATGGHPHRPTVGAETSPAEFVNPAKLTLSSTSVTTSRAGPLALFFFRGGPSRWTVDV